MEKKLPVINEVFKEKRKNKGITQEKLASLIFKSLGTVKRYDTGDTIPEGVIIKLCEILNMDFISLLVLQETKNKLNQENFYENLITKYSKEVEKFNSEYYNFSANLELLAKDILELYKNFYDSSLLEKNKTKIIKYPSYKYSYEIVENKIIISRSGLNLIGENKEKEVLATFNYESGKEFIEDIKLFFNFQHFKIINTKQF